MVKGPCQVIVLHIILTLYKSCNGNQILTQRRKAAKINNRGLASLGEIKIALS